MGLFDRDVRNGFDDMFDWDRDGKLNPWERENQFEFGQKLINSGTDTTDDSDDDWELDAVGLDKTELEFMDDDERREAIEDAGLDPDDYDF